MPDAGKNSERYFGFIGELDAHFFVDVKIFLSPNDGDRRFEPVQIRLEIVLVPREM